MRITKANVLAEATGTTVAGLTATGVGHGPVDLAGRVARGGRDAKAAGLARKEEVPVAIVARKEARADKMTAVVPETGTGLRRKRQRRRKCAWNFSLSRAVRRASPSRLKEAAAHILFSAPGDFSSSALSATVFASLRSRPTPHCFRWEMVPSLSTDRWLSGTPSAR